MPQRRNLGGARREASERVILRPLSSQGKAPQGTAELDPEFSAWTLNMSRGGMRLIIESALRVGERFMASVGDEKARPARVVWLRDELDGQIAGLQFEDVEGARVPGSEYPPAS